MSGQLVLVLRVLLAFALYLFLCLTLWMIWQDLKRAGFQAARPKAPLLRLEIRPSDNEPFFRAFSQTELILGRDPICEICLDDEAISARHLKFTFHHAQWWVEDLNSTNGTGLNQSKLNTPTVLMNGDEIKCGRALLIVGLNTEAAIRQAAAAEEQHD
ncbi:MAG TPA: FHA domain-containing protein [Anaerolineales bacterium]|nr:FHA domain-containing protein [Anaerolineales bacterium]